MCTPAFGELHSKEEDKGEGGRSCVSPGGKNSGESAANWCSELSKEVAEVEQCHVVAKRDCLGSNPVCHLVAVQPLASYILP